MAERTRSNDLLLEMLPLAPASFFVLFALAEENKHGYRIMQDVRELSDGTFTLGPATLYTTIKKLTEQELISELSSAVEDRRRTYRLTAAGRRLLTAEFRRQEALLSLARSRGTLRLGDQK